MKEKQSLLSVLIQVFLHCRHFHVFFIAGLRLLFPVFQKKWSLFTIYLLQDPHDQLSLTHDGAVQTCSITANNDVKHYLKGFNADYKSRLMVLLKCAPEGCLTMVLTFTSAAGGWEYADGAEDRLRLLLGFKAEWGASMWQCVCCVKDSLRKRKENPKIQVCIQERCTL